MRICNPQVSNTNEYSSTIQLLMAIIHDINEEMSLWASPILTFVTNRV